MKNYYGDRNRWFLARVVKGVAAAANADNSGNEHDSSKIAPETPRRKLHRKLTFLKT